MTDQTSAPAVDSTPAPADYTATDLGNMFAEARQKPEPAESAEPATAEPELAQANADPVEPAPSEATEEAEPAEVPPIEPPRSWTKEEKEEFATYPREAQEKIARAATRYESEFRRSQNEIAETRKAVDAERVAMEKARKEIDAKLSAPISNAALVEARIAQEFQDIQSVEHLRKMQAEDPFRFQAWQLAQIELSGARAEQQQIEERLGRERQDNLVKFQTEQTQKLAEFVPEVKDPEKLKALTDKAVTHLKSFGPSDQDLNEYASQGDKPFIFSATFQRILLNSVKYEEIQKAKVAVAAKPAPPVQRPGTAKPAGSAQSETFTKLSAQLERSGDPKDLGALIGHLRRA